MNILAAWLVLLVYLAFLYTPWRTALTRLSKRLGDWTVGLLLLPYLLAVNLRPTPGDLLRFAIYLALPTICLRLRPRQARPFDPFQILAILAIWVPVELDLFLLMLDLAVPGVDLSGQLSGFYLLPQVEATLAPGVELPIHTLTAVSLALFLFLVRHPLKEIGFTFRLGRQELRYALVGLLVFAVVGIPVGLGMGFLRYNPIVPGPLEIILGVIGGYLLIALPEELLFRGIIQNLLTRRLGNERMGLPIASIIFGLAHLNNATAGFAVPNWAYVLMATLAGLAYGWVWNRTRKVTVSAITHMLVNLIWGTVFH
jgi:hypothetical protein